MAQFPSRLQYSQASLQDYVDCRRRFYLRYLARLAWPAVQAEPVQEHERLGQLGERFHRLAQQFLLGLPGGALAGQAAADPDLARWWENFCQTQAGLLPQGGQRFPEVSLQAALPVGAGSCTLAAKLDLALVLPGGQALIFDWKTAARRPGRAWLAARLQTRLYPYLLARAGTHLNGGAPILPAAITLVYWFAEHPAQAERFPYGPARFQADEAYLAALVGEIEAAAAAVRPAAGPPAALPLDPPAFPLAADAAQCRFCLYRSLCGRGAQAGSLAQAETEAGPLPLADFDFEQAAEIEY